MRIAILLTVLAQSSLVWAGVGAHGGNVVSCAGQPSVTLDYYNATLPTVGGAVKTVDVSSMSEDQVIQFLRSRMDGSGFQSAFDRTMARIGKMENWIAADLKSIDDSAEPYALPPNCVRETAAARQGKIMYGDVKVINKLSPAQRGLLRAHEVLYEISGKDTSLPVRDLFRVIMAQDFNAMDMYLAVEAMGSRYAMWDYARWTFWEAAKDSEVKLPGVIGNYQMLLPPFNVVYQYGPSRLHAASYLHMDCAIETQSCSVKKVELRGKSPKFKDCVMKMPSDLVMTFACPEFGGKILKLVPAPFKADD